MDTTKEIFNTVPKTRVKRTTFDRSHGSILSMKSGRVYPVLWCDMAPNDNVSMKSKYAVVPELFAADVMGGIDVHQYHFGVRLRDIIINFSDYMRQDANGTIQEPWVYLADIYFNTRKLDDGLQATDEQLYERYKAGICDEGVEFDEAGKRVMLPLDEKTGEDPNATYYIHPCVGTVAGMLGIPEIGADDERYQYLHMLNSQSGPGTQKVRLAPFYAYFKIWHDFFRDEILDVQYLSDRLDHKFIINGSFYEDMIANQSYYNTGHVPYNAMASDSEGIYHSLFDLLFMFHNKAYDKDYFTSALPWQQAGDPVRMPLGDMAPLQMIYTAMNESHARVFGLMTPTGEVAGTLHDSKDSPVGMYNPARPFSKLMQDAQNNLVNAAFPNADNVAYADLSGAGAADIEEFRYAYAMQRWLERKARNGVSRYEDFCRTMFNEGPRNDQTGHAMYFSGSKATIQSRTITSSAYIPDSKETTLGEKASQGSALGETRHIGIHANEHIIYMSMMCIVAQQTYVDGLRKDLQRLSNFDYPFPDFAELGEEPILGKELYLSLTNESENNKVFGYTPRYAREKVFFDEVHGRYISTDKYFTAFRRLSGPASLNVDFITADIDDMNRIFYADESLRDPFRCQIYFNMKHTQSLPFYGEPTLVL